MTIRQFVYRSLYLVSPGWYFTRWLRKRGKCRKCRSTSNLHLHHINYPFFGVWYRLLWLSLVIWFFHEIGLWMFAALMVTPDFVSRMETLCAVHHARAHGR